MEEKPNNEYSSKQLFERCLENSGYIYYKINNSIYIGRFGWNFYDCHLNGAIFGGGNDVYWEAYVKVNYWIKNKIEFLKPKNYIGESKKIPWYKRLNIIKLLIPILFCLSCTTYRQQNLRGSHSSNPSMAMGYTVRVSSPFERDAYFLVEDSAPDERGRIKVWDLQNGWYVYLSERGMRK